MSKDDAKKLIKSVLDNLKLSKQERDMVEQAYMLLVQEPKVKEVKSN